MKYCKRCLYPENHPLNITFDDQGICSGCRVHEEKDFLPWEERREKLRKILDSYKSKTRGVHDCIVPVSGARDSYFIVDTLKNEFGMHPLLVYYNKQYNTHRGIRNLAHLQTLLGCDLVSKTVSPDLVKKITRETLRLRGSMYWHCLAGQTVFPVRTAVNFKIPLIVWGVHQGCDQVGMFSHLQEVEMTRKYRKEHDLMKLEAEDLAAQSDDLTLNDLEPYKYPHDQELGAVGIRGIYLSNYIRWDSKAQHESMIEKYGYETAGQQRTFDAYNDVDCFHYSGLHDHIKYLKYGYGKVADHACREIRLRRMTREDGAEMVRLYQDVKPDDANLFFKWLGISENDFYKMIDQHRDPLAWEKNGSGWELKDTVLNHIDETGVEEARLSLFENECLFDSNSSRIDFQENEYYLFARGWVDKI